MLNDLVDPKTHIACTHFWELQKGLDSKLRTKTSNHLVLLQLLHERGYFKIAIPSPHLKI
jgi:hypothetical protein